MANLLSSKATLSEVIELVNKLVEALDPDLAAQKRQHLEKEQARSAHEAGHPAGQSANPR